MFFLAFGFSLGSITCPGSLGMISARLPFGDKHPFEMAANVQSKKLIIYRTFEKKQKKTPIEFR
jgi:hypothetical protein